MSTKKKEEEVKSVGATTRVCQMLVERKYTDEEILSTIKKEYQDRSEKQIKVYISCQRNDINAGRKKRFIVDSPIERLIKVDGKIIPKSQAPAKPSKKKIDPENDPLKKIAGIDLQGGKAKAAREIAKVKKLKKIKKKFDKK